MILIRKNQIRLEDRQWYIQEKYKSSLWMLDYFIFF